MLSHHWNQLVKHILGMQKIGQTPYMVIFFLQGVRKKLPIPCRPLLINIRNLLTGRRLLNSRHLLKIRDYYFVVYFPVQNNYSFSSSPHLLFNNIPDSCKFVCFCLGVTLYFPDFFLFLCYHPHEIFLWSIFHCPC